MNDTEILDAIESIGLSIVCQFKDADFAGGARWTAYIYRTGLRWNGDSIREVVIAAKEAVPPNEGAE